MRLKVESVAPLPHVKAWFGAQALPTIYDLKTSLCSDLHAFKHASIAVEDLILLLDDFELLDSSPIDVVRDGDLVVIKKSHTPSQHKRKAPSQNVSSPPRKRSKTDDGRALPKPPTQSNRFKRRAASKSSDSSSESSSDSESSASSSESSDSDSSSSSSSSAPSVKGIVDLKTKVHPDASKSAPSVPPGLGKPSTHSRNLRRRRKKMYERFAATAEPPSVNEIPLGTRARTTEPSASKQLVSPSVESEPSQGQKGKGKSKETTYDLGEPAEPPQFLMASLQNKNKRRGFKDALSRGVPAKITFAERDTVEVDGAGSGHAETDVDAMVVEATLQDPPPSRTQPLRLIPPSEKQELGQLPPNVFVTSVDVEEGMWPSKRKNKKKRKQPPHADESLVQQEDSYPNVLPYDDESAAASQAIRSKDEPAISVMVSMGISEHAAIAAKFDSLKKITEKAQVTAGATVAWTGLSINMTTLTPEYIMHVARVARVDEERLALELVTENGAYGASFGGPITADEDDYDGPIEEEFSWEEVLKGDFRLVSS